MERDLTNMCKQSARDFLWRREMRPLGNNMIAEDQRIRLQRFDLAALENRQSSLRSSPKTGSPRITSSIFRAWSGNCVVCGGDSVNSASQRKGSSSANG